MKAPSRFAAIALVVAGCSTETSNSPLNGGPAFAAAGASPEAAEVLAYMDAVNASLQASGADYRVGIAEYQTLSGGDAVGATILQKDVGNKQLSADFVAFDPRRAWSGPASGSTDNITFAIDQTGDAIPPSTVVVPLTAAQTTAAIRAAMATWDNETCSDIALTENSSGATDIGVVAFLNGLGGSGFVFGDVQHAG